MIQVFAKTKNIKNSTNLYFFAQLSKICMKKVAYLGIDHLINLLNFVLDLNNAVAAFKSAV